MYWTSIATILLMTISSQHEETLAFSPTGGIGSRTNRRNNVSIQNRKIKHGTINNDIIVTNNRDLSSSILNAGLSLPSIVTQTVLSNDPAISVQKYRHKGWNLTYRYKPASPGFERESPILLVHPVGIGLSSWYWENFMQEWKGPAVYAPNLIGCGITEGSDSWKPEEQGMSFPLGWVQGCEALMQQVLSASKNSFWGGPSSMSVMTQGGLAPIGVMLASRNPQVVNKLVLASPPKWAEMTTPVPEKKLKSTLDFFKSPVLGKLAFTILETRWAVGFFSNLFLFADKCDSKWLDKTQVEACEEARPPVMVFNSGFCNHRSFEEELTSLQQPTLILEGNTDVRPRHEYVAKMKNCQIQILKGKNVLPWESPMEVVQALKRF